MPLLVAILSLMTITFSAVAGEDQAFNSAPKSVIEKIQKSSGRIIQVVRGPGFLRIGNTCSATLIGPDQIITAAHCFKTKVITNANGKIKKTLLKTITLENTYFDIDGVTSHNLHAQIQNLLDDAGFIRGKNIKLANDLLKNIPQIQSAKLHPVYLKHMPIEIDRNQMGFGYELPLEYEYLNYKIESVAYDVATAQLSQKINAPIVSIGNYQDGENVYIAGYGGGVLESSLEVYECVTGELALESILYAAETLLSEFKIVLNNLSHTTGSDSINAESLYQHKKKSLESAITLAKDLKNKKQGILSECPGAMMTQGFSGGPQFVIKNNKVLIVGITSTTPSSANKHGELMQAPLANKIFDFKN